jgi:hypothetical protein
MDELLTRSLWFRLLKDEFDSFLDHRKSQARPTKVKQHNMLLPTACSVKSIPSLCPLSISLFLPFKLFSRNLSLGSLSSSSCVCADFFHRVADSVHRVVECPVYRCR